MRSKLALLALLTLLAGAGSAQSLYLFDGTTTVTEITGPSVGLCAYPNGPVNAAFPAAGVLCPGPVPFAPPLGDVAVNPITDVVYVTSGAVISAYSPVGVHLGSAIPPIPGLTGMAANGPGGVLWITDGLIYGAVPLGLGCPVGPVPFVIGPFPVPIGPIFAGPIGDLDWEGVSGSLIACDAAGTVASFLPGPLPAIGPYGAFPVPPVPCPLGPALLGIAFDKAFPGTGIVFVTDGVFIRRMLPGGAPPPPTFYFPMPCIPIPAVLPIAGLAYAGRQITYGIGADNSGLPAPTIGAVGQSYVGTPAYTITLTGSVPGGTAVLKYSLGASCPAPVIVGVPSYLLAPRFTGVILPVGAGGGASITVAIAPGSIPPGVSLFLQWIVLTGVSVQVTSGAEFTTILP
jgi:hypothetical protein